MQTTSPAGYRFEWIDGQPWLIDGADRVAVYPPVMLESGYSDSFFWDQAQASLPVEPVSGGGFLPYEGGGWIAPIVPTFDTGDGGPSYGGALMPANYAVPILDSGLPINFNYGSPIANFSATSTGANAVVTPANVSNAQLIQAVKESLQQGFTLAQTKWGAMAKYGVPESQWNSINWAVELGLTAPTNPNVVTLPAESSPDYPQYPDAPGGGLSPALMISLAVAAFSLLS